MILQLPKKKKKKVQRRTLPQMVFAPNTKHEDYALDLEILACIPTGGAGVRLDDLVRQFRLRGRESVRHEVEKLRARGIKIIEARHDKAGHTRPPKFRMGEETRDEAVKIASDYLEKLYPNDIGAKP